MRTGCTQQEVAARMGTTRSAISRLENAASHRAAWAMLETYARAVGCRLEIRLVPTRAGWVVGDG